MRAEIFERLINEFTELKDRIEKCRNFIIDEEKFNTLNQINKDLLISQLKAMETYLGILAIRIGVNKQDEAEATPDTDVITVTSSNE